MKGFAVCFLLVSLCLSPAMALAQDARPGRLAEEIMVKSGLTDSIPDLKAMWAVGGKTGLESANAQASSQGQALKRSLLKQIGQALESSFDIAAFADAIREVYIQAFSPAQMADILGWLNSPLGKKATRLEKEFSKSQAVVTDAQAEVILSGAANPALRRDQVTRLLNVSGMAEQAVVMNQNMDFAMSLAIAASLSPDDFSPDAIRQAVAARSVAYKDAFRRPVFNTLAAIYQGLTDQEFDALIGFYQTETGKAYMSGSFQALNKAFMEVGGKAGKQIARILKQTPA